MDSTSAIALDIFEKFASAKTCESITSNFANFYEILELQPTNLPNFLPVLKENLTSPDLRDLLSKYERRINSKVYNKGRACDNTNVLVIGAGPCGLRSAIEAQLLGARVVVLEKRSAFSRNNVLHLWPFAMTDLRELGAKRFCPKFCPGSIDHVNIAELQCILLKIALTLGVEVYTGIEFLHLVEPNVNVDESNNRGWTAATTAPDYHPFNSFEFDVIVGADGRQNVLPGFQRKELRAKLAIAITANFVNKRTAAEVQVQEISGVSSIFRQSLFQTLVDETGIDLENIVYYKDETHYFVMTAKKQSLLWKGVLKDNYSDTADLLAPENIDLIALENYTMEAVRFVTNNGLPNLQFAVNNAGKPDLAIFDFTKMYAAENSCRVLERNGCRLLLGLVGDSLLEPFWPTGSGCARGFLSALDAAWMIRSWARGEDVLDVLAERETIYRLLAQTTHDNLNKDFKSYTVDPTTRYPNLVPGKVQPSHITFLVDSDAQGSLFQKVASSRVNNPKRQDVYKETLEADEVGFKKSPSPQPPLSIQSSPLSIQSSPPNLQSSPLNLQSPPLNFQAPPLAESISERSNQPNQAHQQRTAYRLEADGHLDIDFLVNWLRVTLSPYGIHVSGIHDIFVSGDVLCGLIHAFRSDLIPQYPFPPEIEEGIEVSDLAAFRNQIAFDFLNDEYQLPYIVSGYDSVQYTMTHLKELILYLFEVYSIFSNTLQQSPQIQRKKLVRSATFSVRDTNKGVNEVEKSNRTGRCIRNLQQRFQGLQFKPAESNESRTIRRQDAEKCKLKAMEFMSSIQERRTEAQKEVVEARRDKIIKTIRSVHVTQPESSIVQSSSVSTKENDDFFNEYNMRLWRKSVPSMEERMGKLQTAFAAPLPSACKSTEDKKVLKRTKSCASVTPPGAAVKVNTKDWVNKLLAQKFPDAPPPTRDESPPDETEIEDSRSTDVEPVPCAEEEPNVGKICDTGAEATGGIVWDDDVGDIDGVILDKVPERAFYSAQSDIADSTEIEFDEQDENLLELLDPYELQHLEAWTGKYL